MTSATHPQPVTFEVPVGPEPLPYLTDHRVRDRIVFPASGYLEMAAAAAAEVCPGEVALRDVRFHSALLLPEESARSITLQVAPTGSGIHRFQMTTAGADDTGQLHAEGQVEPAAPTPGTGADLAALRARCPHEQPVAEHYRALAERGMWYGPGFQGIRQLWTGAGEAIGRVALPESLAPEAGAYFVHPALLDACLQVLAAAGVGDQGDLWLPVGVDRFRVRGSGVRGGWSHARFRADAGPASELVGDVSVLAEDGSPLVEIEGLQVRRITAAVMVAEAQTRSRLYTVDWRALPPAAPRPAASGGRWIVFDDDRGLGRGLVPSAPGDEWVFVSPQTSDAPVAVGEHRLDPADPAAYHRLLAELTGPGQPPCRGVVFLWPLRAQAGSDFISLRAATHLLQAAGRLDGGSALGPVWIVTSQTQPVADSQVTDPVHASLWGLGRVFAHEHPRVWGGLVDLDQPAPERVADALYAALTAADGEDQVALRAGQRHVPRLCRRPRAGLPHEPVSCDPDGVYLITGGLGGLGLQTAGWLADRGARNLLLIGRTALPPEPEWEQLPPGHPHRPRVQALQALQARGVRVRTAAIDVADREALAALVGHENGNIRGVVHTAGVLRDSSVLQLDVPALEEVLRPKALGALHLDELLAEHKLDFFILFASAASLLGSPGQANYAAANACLDAIAHGRRARGLPALSVDWGPWAGAGMFDQDRHAPHLTDWGVRALAPEDCLAALGELLDGTSAHAAVLSVDWQELVDRFPAAASRAFLAELLPAAPRPAPTDAQAPTGGLSLADLLAAEADQRPRLLADALRVRIAAALKTDPDQLVDDLPLTSYGIDSLMGIELRNHIEQDFGVSLPMAALIGGPTIEDLTQDVWERIGAAPAATAPTEPPPSTVPVGSTFPLSPGQDALWFLYRAAPDSVAYNITISMRMLGELDPAAFVAAWRYLVERHVMLRTTFLDSETGPRARVEPASLVELRVEDASGWSWEEVTSRLSQEAARPFDLEQEPPLRVLLFPRSETEHVMFVSVHHISVDLWSIVVLLDEFGAAYQAARDGVAPTLTPLSVEFPEYLRRQQEVLDGAEGERLWDYWRGQLAGELPVLNLPSDRARPAVQSYRGATVATMLGPELVERLKALGAEHDTTLFTVLLSALQVLLSRETGQSDIVVGSPTAGRSRPEIDRLVGYLVNPLPLRADLSTDPSFRELLQANRQVVLDAFDHEDFPITKMVERLAPVRDASYSPIFQTMFVMQKAHAHDQRGFAPFVLGAGAQERAGGGPTRMRLHGWELESINVDRRAAMFDLTWMMAEGEDGIVVSVDYNTDLFDESTVQRYLSHLETLLENLLADVGVGVGGVGVVSGGELGLVVGGFAGVGSGVVFGGGGCRLEGLVGLGGGGLGDVAVVDGGGRVLSYGELLWWAGRVGGWLRGVGVGRGDVVGVVMEKGWEQVVGVLGVLASGAGFLPVDPGWPVERVRRVLGLGGVRFVVTQSWLRGWVGWPVGVGVLCVEEGDLVGVDVVDVVGGAVGRGEGDGEVAYVLFTSGSTGEPKGVVVDHRGAVNTVLDVCGRFGLGGSDRVLGVSSLGFDLSVFDIFGPLSVGGAVVFPGRGRLDDPGHWVELVGEWGVTVWNSVPQLFGLFVDHVLLGGLGGVVSGLRLALLSGDWIPVGLPDRARGVVSGLVVVGLGGATEGSIWSVVYPVGVVDPLWRSVPYGRPMANQTWFVLDGWLRPCPVGVVGELFIGGVGVALGYWGDGVRSAERFVPDPFGGVVGGRLYRTGDVGRWLSSGELEFLGRVDTQVKVRGFRVELGEVEVVLGLFVGVVQVVVVVRGGGGGGGGERLVAYVVVESGVDVVGLPLLLREWAGERLPDYMVPSQVVVLDSLPLTANGKVDRRGLPEPVVVGGVGGGRGPVGFVEEVLVEVWSQVLGVGSVGVDDNFFELGGDSILSIQVVSRAGQRGVGLTPTMLFQYQTVAELALVAGESVGVVAVQGEVVGPVVAAPVWGWFEGLGLPVAGFWNQAVMVEVVGDLDVGVLREALGVVVGQHDLLRLRVVDGVYVVGSVVEGGVVPVWEFEFSGVGDVSEWVGEMASVVQGGGSLVEGGLFRVGVFRCGVGVPVRLMLVAHHLVVDALSWRVLLEDLDVAYRGLLGGGVVELPAKTTDFGLWSRRVGELAVGEVVGEQVGWWLERVPSVVPRLPRDGGGVNVEGEVGVVSVWLDEGLSGGLLGPALGAYQSRVEELVLAGVGAAVSGWCGGGGLLVDVERHGRDVPVEGVDVSRTVGWFTAIVPVWLEFGGGGDWGGVVRGVKEVLRSVPGGGWPWMLGRWGRGDELSARLGGLPRAEVSFNYLGRLDPVVGQRFRVVDGVVGVGRHPDNPRPYVLDVVAGVWGGRLRVDLVYGGWHRLATVERLAGAVERGLRGVVEHCLDPGVGGYTPSDFPQAQVSSEELSRFMDKMRDRRRQ